VNEVTYCCKPLDLDQKLVRSRRRFWDLGDLGLIASTAKCEGQGEEDAS